MKRRLNKILVLILLIFVSSMTTAKDSKMLLDQIPLNPMFNPQTPLDSSQHQAEQTQLRESVDRVLKGKYRVVAQRIFLDPVDQGISPVWVTIKPDADNAIFDKFGGKTEHEYPLNTPDPAIIIWKIGFLHPQRLAMSMSTLPNGDALVGYFEVEKE
jgi:hypothetical protein